VAGISATQRRRGVRVEVEGLEDFEKDLRKFKRDIEALERFYVKASGYLRDRARAAAPTKLTGSIRRLPSRDAAAINIVRSPPRALGVFMGAKRRFGWYAQPKYAQSVGRQFPKWVGNQWEPGMSSGKPYHIGSAINAAVPKIMDMFADEIERKAGIAAFPEKGGRLSDHG